MGTHIKKGYAGLFKLHPNAHLTDREALRNYFATESQRGDESVSAMVNTFQSLCELAVFNEKESTESTSSLTIAAPEPTLNVGQKSDLVGGIQGLTINIQLTLPESTDQVVYQEIFKAMNEHLIGRNQ